MFAWRVPFSARTPDFANGVGVTSGDAFGTLVAPTAF